MVASQGAVWIGAQSTGDRMTIRLTWINFGRQDASGERNRNSTGFWRTGIPITESCRPGEIDLDQSGAFTRTIKMRSRNSEHE